MLPVLQPLLQAFIQRGGRPKLRRLCTREHGHSPQILYGPVSQRAKPQLEASVNAAQGYWMRSVR